MLLFSIIIGFIIGFTISFYIVVKIADKTNNYGDSTGEFYDFSKLPIHIKNSKNNIRNPY